jgi:O-acetyl-ADP-ribose deacetylase (regulator of RNase III)
MSLELVRGDIVTSKEQYIIHQCNCSSTSASGLAGYLFKLYPYANVYKERVQHSMPGTIDIRGNGKEERYIINLFGQYFPGIARSVDDTVEYRIYHFLNGLRAVADINGIESIAFPWMIGCGLAGGDWDKYYYIIKMWSALHSDIKVVVYQLEE